MVIAITTRHSRVRWNGSKARQRQRRVLWQQGSKLVPNGFKQA
ncbi:MAG: hypothetical protein ACR2OU_10995 [Thermomicrobiales bacterium]